MSTDYSKLLRDPHWQRKRLQVLEKQDFSCELCGANDKPLHVHHGYYEKNKKPWEYDDETLHSLCEDCHSKTQEHLGIIKKIIARIPPSDLILVWDCVFAVLTAPVGPVADITSFVQCRKTLDYLSGEVQSCIDYLQKLEPKDVR